MLNYSVLPIGFFVAYGNVLGHTTYKHVFCGSHEIKGAICHNCNKALIRFMSLDLSDPKISRVTSGMPYIHLLFCWTCSASEDVFSYRILGNGSVELIYAKSGPRLYDFPYPEYPISFPMATIMLSQISDSEQRVIKSLNAETYDRFSEIDSICDYLIKPRHQIGGEPYLVQKAFDEVICCICGSRMPFLASIADDCLDNRGFTGNKFVQVLFYLCDDCHMISAIQRCD